MNRVKSEEIQKVIAQMKKVMRVYKMLGIAAPQIGVSHRIICIECPKHLLEQYPEAVCKTRQMNALPMTVSSKCNGWPSKNVTDCFFLFFQTFINPVLEVTNFNLKTFPEGSASVCGYVSLFGF